MDQKPAAPKRRRTRDQLQARAQASARHRAKVKAKGLPTTAQIDSAIATLFVSLLSKRQQIKIPADYLPEVVPQVLRWGRWEHFGEEACLAVEARISKLGLMKRPGALPDGDDVSEPAVAVPLRAREAKSRVSVDSRGPKRSSLPTPQGFDPPHHPRI